MTILEILKELQAITDEAACLRTRCEFLKATIVSEATLSLAALAEEGVIVPEYKIRKR